MRANDKGSVVWVGFLLALCAGWGQAVAAPVSEQQQVAHDLLNIVGATPGRCAEILPQREYALLAAQDKAGWVVCGKYTSSVSEARATCEEHYAASGLTTWESWRNHLQGTFVKGGYRYTITMTCRGDEFVVKIDKVSP